MIINDIIFICNKTQHTIYKYFNLTILRLGPFLDHYYNMAVLIHCIYVLLSELDVLESQHVEILSRGFRAVAECLPVNVVSLD